MTPTKVLVFIVAFEAEETIGPLLGRIDLPARYELHSLIIDDASTDLTFREGQSHTAALPYPCTVLRNPIRQGYGGNQKLGYQFAVLGGFDIVVLLHGDGQYAPESMAELVEPIGEGSADAVLGSRMLVKGAARRGGMPAYKWLGNRILST